MGCSVSIVNPLPETLHSANTVVTASMVLCNAIPPLLSLILAAHNILYWLEVPVLYTDPVR